MTEGALLHTFRLEPGTEVASEVIHTRVTTAQKLVVCTVDGFSPGDRYGSGFDVRFRVKEILFNDIEDETTGDEVIILRGLEVANAVGEVLDEYPRSDSRFLLSVFQYRDEGGALKYRWAADRLGPGLLREVRRICNIRKLNQSGGESEIGQTSKPAKASPKKADTLPDIQPVVETPGDSKSRVKSSKTDEDRNRMVKTRVEFLHLRNATTADPVKKPYTLPDSLIASKETGYFVLQYAFKDLTAEEHLRLETGYKIRGKSAVALSDTEEAAIVRKMDTALENLEAELRKDDEDTFEIIAPLAVNGWLIRSSRKKGELAKLDNVRFVDIFHPALKLTGTLFDQIANPGSSEKIGLVLTLFSDGDSRAVAAGVTELGGLVKVVDHISFVEGPKTGSKKSTDKVVGAVIPATALKAVAHLPQVHLIDEDSLPGMLMDTATVTTHVRAAGGAAAANYLNLSGAGQVIGVCDTGVDNGGRNPVPLGAAPGVGHGVVPAPAALVADLNNRVTGDVANWHDVNISQSWASRMYDGTGPIVKHGNAVTGIAIGNGNLSGGLIRGVAYGAQAVIRPFSADFRAGWPNLNPMIFNISRALWNAYHTHNARVHNNSWGETLGPNFGNLVFFTNQYRLSDRRIDHFTLNRPQMLVVTSSGNRGGGGGNPNTITSPGTGKNVLTVGNSGNGNPATGNAGVAGSAPAAVSGSSSRGPAPSGRLKPDVVAPGDQIASIRPQAIAAAGGGNPPDYAGHDEYAYGPGTSYAAPHVSGMAALIRQFLNTPALHGANAAIIGQRAQPSGMLIKAFIVNGAERLNPAGAHIPNNDEGWGRVNLQRSINPAQLLLVYDSRDGADPHNAAHNHGNAVFMSRGNRTEDFTIQVAAGVPLSITLVWYDRLEGGGAGALVYDLDLILRRNHNNDLYRGGVPGFHNGESRRLHTRQEKRNANFRDNRNTVEKIYVANPAAGACGVRVKARSIPWAGLFSPAARVPFALVVRQG